MQKQPRPVLRFSFPPFLSHYRHILFLSFPTLRLFSLSSSLLPVSVCLCFCFFLFHPSHPPPPSLCLSIYISLSLSSSLLLSFLPSLLPLILPLSYLFPQFFTSEPKIHSQKRVHNRWRQLQKVSVGLESAAV